jgi:hypothetical protein
MNYDRYILEALQKAVINASLTIPVKYVGRIFNPPTDGKWIEVIYIPNSLGNEYWSDGKIYKGVVRLVLHWPIDNAGAYPALDMMRNISDKFIKGSKFSDPSNNVIVSIVDHPNINDVIEKAPEMLVPLTIKYSCFKVS